MNRIRCGKQYLNDNTMSCNDIQFHRVVVECITIFVFVRRTSFNVFLTRFINFSCDDEWIHRYSSSPPPYCLSIKSIHIEQQYTTDLRSLITPYTNTHNLRTINKTTLWITEHFKWDSILYFQPIFWRKKNCHSFANATSKTKTIVFRASDRNFIYSQATRIAKITFYWIDFQINNPKTQ